MGLTHAARKGDLLLLLLERGHPTDPNPALLQKEGHHQLGMYVRILRARLLNKVERRDLSLTIVDVSRLPVDCK